MGYYINPQLGYYEGDPISPADTEVTARPSGTLSTPSKTITLPTGGTVTLASQPLTVSHTWDGSAWVADLVALRAAKLALIRGNRDTLLSVSDRLAKDSNTAADGSADLTLASQAGRWATKLRDIPNVVSDDLDALTDAASIAAYEPDFAVPERLVILTVLQFRKALFLAPTPFITAEEFQDNTTIPASIEAVFAAMPTTPINQQALARGTWFSMQTVSRNDPLVTAAATAWGLSSADVDGFFDLGATL